MSELARSLRDGLVVAPGCYDRLSAVAVYEQGFGAGYVTPFGITGAVLGYDPAEDSWPAFLRHLERMCSATPLPLIADGLTGIEFGRPAEDVAADLVAAGASAVVIEDRREFRGEQLSDHDVRAQVERVKAVLPGDGHVALVGRTDRFLVSEAAGIDRCGVYLDAGCDLAMPLMTRYLEIPATAAAYYDRAALHRRIIAGLGRGRVLTSSPQGAHLSVQDAAAFGYGAYIMPQIAIGAAYTGIRAALAEVAEPRHTIYTPSWSPPPPKALASSLGNTRWLLGRWPSVGG